MAMALGHAVRGNGELLGFDPAGKKLCPGTGSKPSGGFGEGDKLIICDGEREAVPVIEAPDQVRYGEVAGAHLGVLR
jgi:hypothetical protein